MFNPLAPWNEAALEGFIKAGMRYFVRQTFNRAKNPFDENIKGYFLFCHYQDYAPAKEHFDAITDDPNRFLYDWEEPEHRAKLQIAASHSPGYKLYTNTFMPKWEQHLTPRIKQKIRAYMTLKGWKPRREEGVQVSFFPHFGEVMINLKFGRQQLRVKFEDIEKLS
jgi:hypothetical protein